MDWNNVDWKSAPAIEELPVQSAIAQPAHNSILPPNSNIIPIKGIIIIHRYLSFFLSFYLMSVYPIYLTSNKNKNNIDKSNNPILYYIWIGYAWSGAGKGIIRVDVSIDGGKSWHTADLQAPDQSYNRVCISTDG